MFQRIYYHYKCAEKFFIIQNKTYLFLFAQEKLDS